MNTDVKMNRWTNGCMDEMMDGWTEGLLNLKQDNNLIVINRNRLTYLQNFFILVKAKKNQIPICTLPL